MENTEPAIQQKKYKAQQYERIGTLSLEEVFYYIKENLDNPAKKNKIHIRMYYVNVNSLRLRTFYHTGIDCPCCDTKASFFAVERSSGNPSVGYHLNLYGLDKNNQEVLFTHDHTLARSLGGEDHLSNTETMCGPCNWAKGTIENKLGKEISEEERTILLNDLQKYQHHKKNKVKI